MDNVNSFEHIVNLVKAADGKVIDDLSSDGKKITLSGLAVLRRNGIEREIIVGLHDDGYFSLNLVYLEDGKPHLSILSQGGVITPMNFGGNLELAIEDYNKQAREAVLSFGTLHRVTLF